MKSDKVFNDVVRQHEAAVRMFKGGYSFDTKQRDILFHLEMSVRKHQSEQLADQNKVAALNKKIEKRQILIDELNTQLETSNMVTEEDITNDRE